MPKSVPPEVVEKVLKLHREGNSYRKIGAVCGIDQRTVKAAVQRETVKRGRDYWERVSSEADVELLRQHYRLLLLVGAGIRAHIERNDPKSVALGGLATDLDDCIRLAVGEAADLFQVRGVGVAANDGEADFTALVRALAPGLKEALLGQHEPQLGAALREWEELAGTLAKKARALERQAQALLAKAGLAEGTASALQGWLGQEALETLVIGKGPLSSRVEEGAEGKTTLVRHDERRLARAVYEGTCDGVEEARKAYELALNQAGSGSLPSEAKQAYDALAASARTIEGLLNDIVMRGRPQGECGLCPGRPRAR